MKISEIEKVIVSKTITDYEKFDKALISLRDISFVINYEGKQIPSFVLQSTYYDIGSNILNKETKLNHLIYDSVKELVEEISKERKINKGTFTIYPSGEYESSFIWDEEAHLDKLKTDIKSWFLGICRYSAERVQDRCGMLSLTWDFETEVQVSFTQGCSNPMLFITENNQAMTFSLYLHQIYFYLERDYLEEFEEMGKILEDFKSDGIDSQLAPHESAYFLMNEGELKGHYPRWNVASFAVKPSSNISFEDVKFEWREDLA